MKKLTSLFTVFFAVIAFALAACGGSSTSSGPVNLTFWYTEGTNEAPAILKIVSNFNSSHSNIHVTAQYVDFNSAHDKFATAAAAGSGAPDVIRTDIAWTSEFAKKGYLLNLDGKVGDTADFLPAALAYNQYNGHLYGLPEVTDFLAMYYNKALLQKAGITTPPATMDQLQSDLKTLTTGNQYGFATSGSSYFALPFIFADGGGMISDDAKQILVNNSGAVSGLNRLLTILNTDKTAQPLDLQNGYNNMDTGFKSGQVAIIFNGPWQATDLMSGSAFQGANAANFGVAPVPTGTAGDVPRSPVGGQNYSIYAGSAHTDAAVTFLNYLDSTQSQIAVATANGTLPTRQSAYQDSTVLANPVIKDFQPILSTGKSRPVNPIGGQLFGPFDKDIQNALAGKQSAQDALNQVAKDWQTLISQS